MFTEAAIRILFRIPGHYTGMHVVERGLWLFSFCDSDIEVDLRRWAATESHMGWDWGHGGHCFVSGPWCAPAAFAA